MIADRYAARADAFEAKVARVRDDQWDNPSPCAKWTARGVVDHVIDMHGVMLGAAIPRTGQDETIPPADVRRLWATATSVPPELMERFRTPGAFGPGIEVYGAEVPVPADAPLQDRLLGYVGRDPVSKKS